MKCVRCHSSKLSIKNSRKQPSGVWRRRACETCGLLFTTYEEIDIAKLLRIQESVRKKQLRPYSRGPLLRTLFEIFNHTNAADTPLFLLETIEASLLEQAARSDFVITAAKMHDTILSILTRYDKLAALNYKARLG